MLYLKTFEIAPREYEPMSQWGRFLRYLEIGDDLFALRHVDVFENGYALRYDRAHWADQFGILADMRYDKKKWEKWWGPSIAIEAAEFEEQWRLAESSPTRPMQLGSAEMSRMGLVPIWLLPRINRA